MENSFTSYHIKEACGLKDFEAFYKPESIFVEPDYSSSLISPNLKTTILNGVIILTLNGIGDTQRVFSFDAANTKMEEVINEIDSTKDSITKLILNVSVSNRNDDEYASDFQPHKRFKVKVRISKVSRLKASESDIDNLI